MSNSLAEKQELPLPEKLDGRNSSHRPTVATRTHDSASVRKAVLKLDLTCVSVMAMFYFLSFLDRANLGNARVAGLQKDLGLSDHQYSVALTVTYVPYIAAEIPGNLLLKKIGPRILMPVICTSWGLITTLQGLVKSYSGLIIARFFLGLVEGAMFPSIVLYLSLFYTRAELQLRIAMFFSTASLAGAFSGLLAYGIIRLDGHQGLAGWSWVFILEGIFTFCFGVLSFFITQDSPADHRFLTEEEKSIVIQRLRDDRPTAMDEEERFSWTEVFQTFCSVHVWLQFAALALSGTQLYGLAYFGPSIVNSLGFSAVKTQVLSVPPYAVGFVVMLVSAYLSDRYRARNLCTAIVAAISLIGYVIFYKSSNRNIRYASLFLSVAGTYSTPPPLSALMANNAEPHYRRATAVAWGFVATNAGGILSTWMFPSHEAPRYRTGTVLSISFATGLILLPFVSILWLRKKNAQKEAQRDRLLTPFRDDGKDGEARAWRVLGDAHPDFKYAY